MKVKCQQAFDGHALLRSFYGPSDYYDVRRFLQTRIYPPVSVHVPVFTDELGGMLSTVGTIPTAQRTYRTMVWFRCSIVGYQSLDG